MFKYSVVVGGGEREIAVDAVKGRSVNLIVVHTTRRMMEGGRG